MTDVSTIEDNSVMFWSFSESQSSQSYRIDVSELPTGGSVYWRYLDQAQLRPLMLGYNGLSSLHSMSIERFQLVFVPDADFNGNAGTFRGVFGSVAQIS